MMRAILAELTGTDVATGLPETFYFSDQPMPPFRSSDPDRPDRAYDPRLIDPANIARDITLDLAGFEATLGGGSMVLSNADGALNALRGYAFGSIALYWGAMGDPFSGFTVLLAGRAGQPEFRLSASSPGRVVVPVFDARAELDVDIQEVLYAGTNAGPAMPEINPNPDFAVWTGGLPDGFGGINLDTFNTVTEMAEGVRIETDAVGTFAGVVTQFFIEAGRTYRVECEIAAITGAVRLDLTDASSFNVFTAPGVYSFDVTGSTIDRSMRIVRHVGGLDCTIASLSVRPYPDAPYGGYEGTADDLKGRPKPLALGDLTRGNVTAPAVNTHDLAEQLHDGPFEAVTTVYNGGGDAGLVSGGTATDAAFDAAAPAAGTYLEDRVRGLVKRGTSLANQATYDLRGASDTQYGGGYEDTPGPLMARVLRMTGIAEARIGASVTGFAGAAKMGIWIDEPKTALGVVNAFARSAGVFCLPDAAGVWQVARLRAPAGAPVLTLEDDDLIDLTPDTTVEADPVWKVIVAYARNYTPMRRADMQAAVHGTAREAFLVEPWRRTSAENQATRDRWPEAREVEIETALVEEADAAALAADLLALMGPRADGTPRTGVLAKVEMTSALLALPLGAEIHVRDARAGLDTPMLVLGMSPTTPARHLMTLRLYG